MFPALFFLLFALLLASAASGALKIPAHVMLSFLCGESFMPDSLEAMERSVFLDVRLPRVLFGALAGAALALSGATMQALFRNPLAEPGLVGVSAGGALGAVGAIVLGGGSFLLLAPAAFCGSLAATFAAYTLGRRYPGMAGILLAGIAINAFFGSLIGLFTYLADDQQLRSLTFWSMGSLNGARWSLLAGLFPWLVLLAVINLRLWRALNALLLGEREAMHLGFPIVVLRRKIIVLCALQIGPLVAATGGIGFVGLVVPHLLRLLVGAEHRRLLPATILGGAIALVLADWVARVAVIPAELPIGMITSLIGAPFFLYLLLRGQR